MRNKDTEVWGLSWKRATYLCDTFGIPGVGKGKPRTLSPDDFRFLLVADTLLELFTQKAAVDMALKLRALCTDLSCVGLVYWVGKDHRCTLLQPEEDTTDAVFTLNIPHAIRRKREHDEMSTRP